MQIDNLFLIHTFVKKHASAKKALDMWIRTVKAAKWKNHADLKSIYLTADLVKPNYVFNVKGNTYRIVAKVDFENGDVLVLWVGKHDDYDKLIIKNI